MILKPIKQSAQEKFNFIRLARSHNIGAATFFRLLEIFETASKALENVADFSKKGGARKGFQVCNKNLVEIEIDKTQKFGAKILTFYDDDYPRMLREIYDPAPVLTLLGDEKLLNEDIIAIVGPRNASFHACKFAGEMARELSENEVVIASGLAKGIDGAAHKGCLDFKTIAVMAGGIDYIYPPEHKELYNDISQKGVIITELPFGVMPRGANFIQRNRIISGLSYGVVVVEASMQSGSLATARFCLEQGREVFAVPGFPNDPRNFGSNSLLEDGAIFTQNAARILRELPILRARFSEAGRLQESEIAQFEQIIPKEPSDQEIAEIREIILQKIGFVSLSIADLTQQLQLSARLLNIALVQLELADKITINFGNIIKK